jgi:hypothetical protein
MLVYVRVADWSRIMVPVTKDDIGPYLRDRLEVRLDLSLVHQISDRH